MLLAGCSTVNSRIHEKAAMFDALPAATQEKIRKGIVEVGYTPDMVYVAMGAPDEKRGTISKKGNRTTWIYNVYYQDWVGRRLLGYQRVLVRDSKTNRAYVLSEPVYEDIYRNRKEQRIRIEFTDGAVSVIEQRK